MKLSIDVIIPTFTRPARIPGLVAALEKQLTQDDSLYIIWQGGKKPFVRDSMKIHSLYSSPPNLPRARNRGIAEGTGDILLFFDDDVEVISTDILEAHRQAYGNNTIGAVAGYIDDPFFIAPARVPSAFDESTGELIQNFSIAQSQYCISVMGAHMSFKRETLARIGGFDERFKGNALWEEIDCAFKIRKAGWEIYYCAEAKVRHCREPSGGCRNVKEQSPRYIYHQFANTAYFAARHAKPKHYRSWLRFWGYRLEFITRARWFFFKHDPFLVGAGMLGACGGIMRCLMNRNKKLISYQS